MIRCENLVKIYKNHQLEVVALQGLDLTVDTGEVMAIVGNSGSGKSTLLNMLGGLDKPSAGQLFINNQNMLMMADKERTRFKRDTVGFVWQNNARNLIPYLTARENVEIPMLLQGRRNKIQALELLEVVGLHHRQNNVLYQLSGGEQQRVAIAIAISNSPKLLLADEPTGSVDTKNAAMILDLFHSMNRDFGLTIVIVTHDQQLAKRVNRVVAIRDGRTSSELILKKSYKEWTEEADLDLTGIEAEGESHDEFAVMDIHGRLQVPSHLLEAIGAKNANKVRLILEENRIIMENPDARLMNLSPNKMEVDENDK